MSTDVSEEHIASIFRVEEQAIGKKRASNRATWFIFLARVALLPTCFHAVFFLGLFSDPEDGGDMFLRNVG
jgi:hypothetical protein